jgi:hypothetical protein
MIVGEIVTNDNRIGAERVARFAFVTSTTHVFLAEKRVTAQRDARTATGCIASRRFIDWKP